MTLSNIFLAALIVLVGYQGYECLRWYQKRKLARRMQQILERSYNNVDAMTISHCERLQFKGQPYAFTYGEIHFPNFAMMLNIVQPQPGEIFYDLGSGAGKAVLCAALLYDWKKCCGIELLPGLHQLSLEQLKKLSDEISRTQKSCIQFINQDFLTYDFSDADVIFINATGFHGENWDKVIPKLLRLKTGARIILTSKQLSQENFQLLDAFMTLMSWGMNSVYIYRKLK